MLHAVLDIRNATSVSAEWEILGDTFSASCYGLKSLQVLQRPNRLPGFKFNKQLCIVFAHIIVVIYSELRNA
jgi:hypothetical protein